MQANPEIREESTKLPKEKLGTKMSAGLSKDPEKMKSFSLIGAQAAKEEQTEAWRPKIYIITCSEQAPQICSLSKMDP